MFGDWIMGLKLSLFNAIIVNQFPFHLGWYFISDKFATGFDWFHILTGPIVVLFYIIVVEILFYVTHRHMHYNKFFYNNVHIQHHYWYKPYAITGIACHPVEHLAVNCFSTYVPLFLFPYVHIIWVSVYIHIVMISVSFSHSGWNYVSNNFHDLHHKKIMCNYGLTGVFYSMDKYFGTYYEE